MTVNRLHNPRLDKIISILSKLNPETALSITEIYQQIKDEFKCTRKTVERDIDKLSSSFKIKSTEGGTAKYYIDELDTTFYHLTFSTDQIHTIILALEHLRRMAPKFITETANGVEDVILSKIPKAQRDAFINRKKMTSVTTNILGSADKVDPNVYKTVIECIEKNVLFECYYKTPFRSEEETKHKRMFGPLKLNFSNGTPYVLCYDASIKQIRSLKLTRIKEIKPTQLPCDQDMLKKIDLKYSMGGYGSGHEKIIDYKVIGDKIIANHFKEYVFNESQEVIELSPNCYQITFTLNDSHDVIRLLAQYGPNIESIEPKEVYEKVVTIWREGLKKAG
jgi:predicted DNA-binding transcriptional regulator YafY